MFCTVQKNIIGVTLIISQIMPINVPKNLEKPTCPDFEPVTPLYVDNSG